MAELKRRERKKAEEAQRVLARRHLMDFVQLVDPSYEPAAHLAYIAGWLERVEQGEVKRLMIFAPPRHGKSKLTSELWPAWCLGRDPSQQFMVTSHTAELAYTFSRNVRNMIEMETYGDLFPSTQLSADNATVQRWTLAGRTRPAMLAVGVGGSPTGQGARVIIIDDPIGKAEEADSLASRESVYTWYTDTIRPRLEPRGAVICMMQRWHEDDLAGRLLNDANRKGEKWQVVTLPAIAEEADPLSRPVGDALWPARWPLPELDAIRGVSERSWLAKYQQKPRPAEGSIFKKPWLRIVDAAPAGLRWVRYYDLAYSLKQQADNTATVAGAFGTDGTLYLRRGRAGKMESPDARKMIKELMLDENDTRHGVEAKAHGAPMVQELMRERDLVNIALRAVDVHVDKIARAQPVADRAEMGKLAFVRESVNDDTWIADWVEEMSAFPFAAHDDRVDAVSGVFAMMSSGTPGWVQFAKSEMERRQAQESDAQKEGQHGG